MISGTPLSHKGQKPATLPQTCYSGLSLAPAQCRHLQFGGAGPIPHSGPIQSGHCPKHLGGHASQLLPPLNFGTEMPKARLPGARSCLPDRGNVFPASRAGPEPTSRPRRPLSSGGARPARPPRHRAGRSRSSWPRRGLPGRQRGVAPAGERQERAGGRPARGCPGARRLRSLRLRARAPGAVAGPSEGAPAPRGPAGRPAGSHASRASVGRASLPGALPKRRAEGCRRRSAAGGCRWA